MLISWWSCLFSTRSVTEALFPSFSFVHLGWSTPPLRCSFKKKNSLYYYYYYYYIPIFLSWSKWTQTPTFNNIWLAFWAPVHFVQTTLKLSSGLSFVLPRHYLMKCSICLCSEWCIFSVILPGSCWSPLKMTVIENMLLWKRHASALFWSSSFSTSASPHSDLFSCRTSTGFGLESSGKGAFSYWGRLWIVLSHLWREQDRIGYHPNWTSTTAKMKDWNSL